MVLAGSGTGYWVPGTGTGCRVVGTGYRVQGCRYRVQGTGTGTGTVLAWLLYWPGYCTGCGCTGLGYCTGMATVLAWPGYGVPPGLTTAGILDPLDHPRDPIATLLAAIVSFSGWRLPQP